MFVPLQIVVSVTTKTLFWCPQEGAAGASCAGVQSNGALVRVIQRISVLLTPPRCWEVHFVLTSVEFSGLLCSHVWEQQPAHESSLWGPISGLETSDWKRFEAKTRINSFIVGFLFLFKNSRTPAPAGGFCWTEDVIHPQAGMFAVTLE